MRPHFFVLLLLIGLTINACGSTQSEQVDSKIVYGLTFEPSGIDPHIHQSAELGIVLRQVYDTLVYRDPESEEIVPGLATDWDISEDGLVYTFNLRQDVTFHDGTPFNAQAVGANLDRIVNPDTASQRARFMLGTYNRYEIVDDYTIRFILTEPYSPLLDALSLVYLGMASPVALSEYSTNRYQFHQVGTGPYEFIEYVPNDRIVIRRYDDYNWGPTFYDVPGENHVEEIEFQFFVDDATRLLALESGDADVMGEIPPVDARTLSGVTQIELLPIPVPGQPLQFLFNTTRYPTDNLAMRQALIQATNRNAIVDTVFQGFSPVAWGPLSEGTQFYDRGVVGIYEFDTQAARDTLTAQGLTDSDNDGIREAGEGDLEIIVVVPPWGNVPQVAQLLQDQWRDVGIRVILRQVPNLNSLQEIVDSGEYNLVSFDTPGYDPAFLNDYFLTGAVRNWMNYSNPELDAILREAVVSNDSNVRRALYAQAQRIIMNEALILPIREYRNLNATDGDIAQLDFDTYGWFPVINNMTIQQSE